MALWMTIPLILLPFAQLSSGMRTDMGDTFTFMTEGNQSTTVECPPDLPDLPHFDEKIEGQCKTSQFGTLFVACISATDLMQKSWFRDNRALCRVEMVSKTRTRESPGGPKPARVGKMFETATVSGKNPEWNEAFRYDFACVEAAKEMKDYMLQVQIKDEGLIFGTKSHLGYNYIDFDKFSDFSDVKTEEFELEGNRAAGADDRTTKAEGKVKISIRWCTIGDDKCVSEANAAFSIRGSDWTDCHDGCHNALVEKLNPIYKRARNLMATAVQAGKDEKKYDDIEDQFEEKAKELEEWLEEHPIDEHWKHFVRPGPPPCPPCPDGHGGPEQPPCPACPGPRALTDEEQFALLWQAKHRDYENNDRLHDEFKKKEEEAEKKAKKAFSEGKDAMDTIGDQLVEGAQKACGESVVSFIKAAGDKITKMPDGKFKIKKAEEAVRQLDDVWKSIANFKDCLLTKWKQGELLPSREVETFDKTCFEAITS